jgi:CheY-like chemotaxis protein
MTTLLIIEDDPLILRMYQQAFAFNDKHEALIADNGRDGLEKARSEKPDAILLDIMMPSMNGLEVLKKLKADPDTKKIPVIMLTNLGGDKDIKTALKMGAVKYIVKAENTPKQVLDQVEEIITAATRDRIPD